MSSFGIEINTPGGNPLFNHTMLAVRRVDGYPQELTDSDSPHTLPYTNIQQEFGMPYSKFTSESRSGGWYSGWSYQPDYTSHLDFCAYINGDDVIILKDTTPYRSWSKQWTTTKEPSNTLPGPYSDRTTTLTAASYYDPMWTTSNSIYVIGVG